MNNSADNLRKFLEVANRSRKESEYIATPNLDWIEPAQNSYIRALQKKIYGLTASSVSNYNPQEEGVISVSEDVKSDGVIKQDDSDQFAKLQKVASYFENRPLTQGIRVLDKYRNIIIECEKQINELQKKAKELESPTIYSKYIAEWNNVIKKANNKLDKLKNESLDVFLGLRIKEFLGLIDDLSASRMAHTEYVKSQIETTMNALNSGHVFLHGPYGAGKSTIAKEAAIMFSGDNIQFISCSKNIDTSKWFTIESIKAENGGTTSSVRLGLVYEIAKKGGALILDEINTLSAQDQMQLQALRDIGTGIKFTPNGEDPDTSFYIPKSFRIIATGNLPAPGILSRSQMDSSFLSGFELIEHTFLPQSTTPVLDEVIPEDSDSELFRVLMAMIANKKDNESLKKGEMIMSEENIKLIWGFASFCAKIQNYYISTEEAVIDVGGTPIDLNDAIDTNPFSMRGIKRIMEKYTQDNYQNLEKNVTDWIDTQIPQSTNSDARNAIKMLWEEHMNMVKKEIAGNSASKLYTVNDIVKLFPDKISPPERTDESLKVKFNRYKIDIDSLEGSTTQPEILAINTIAIEYASGKRDFSNEKYEYMDLSDMDVRDCNFSGCTFYNCNFENAQLRHCDFSGADFTGSILKNAGLADSTVNAETIFPDGAKVTKYNRKLFRDTFKVDPNHALPEFID